MFIYSGLVNLHGVIDIGQHRFRLLFDGSQAPVHYLNQVPISEIF